MLVVDVALASLSVTPMFVDVELDAAIIAVLVIDVALNVANKEETVAEVAGSPLAIPLILALILDATSSRSTVLARVPFLQKSSNSWKDCRSELGFKSV